MSEFTAPYKERSNTEQEKLLDAYDAWREEVLKRLSATYESNRDLWIQNLRDQEQWSAYYELTTEAWDKGLYVWYCAFCNRIEWASAVQMSGCAADLAEGCMYPERRQPPELQSRPEYSMPVSPKGWEMSNQGPICITCQKEHEYESAPALASLPKTKSLTCYINGERKQLSCE